MVDYPIKTIPQLGTPIALIGSHLIPVSQGSNTRPVSLDAFAAFVLSGTQAGKIATWNAGTTAPAGAVKGTPWLDTSTTPLHNLKEYDGTDWISLGILDITNNRFTPALLWMTAGTIRGRRPGSDGLETQITLAQMKADLGILSIYESGEQTITSAGALTLAHGLGIAPKIVQMFLVCKTAEQGHAVGDIVAISNQYSNSAVDNLGVNVVLDATNISLRYGASTTVFVLQNKSTGVAATVANANWRLLVKALA